MESPQGAKILAPNPVQPLPCSMYPTVRGLSLVLVNSESGPVGIRGYVAWTEVYLDDAGDAMVGVVTHEEFCRAELLGEAPSDFLTWPAQFVFVL